MTPNSQMELLSLAYVRAVAAYAGYQVSRPEIDNDSIDGILIASVGRRARIDFQAKATTQDLLRGDRIRFPLSIKNYNDLCASTLTPRILVVLMMPQDRDMWLGQTNEELCLRRCAYWMSLENLPKVPNKNSVTVYVPTANIFSSEQLVNLMRKVEKGETLC
jgi:hypothetical protein